jgi:GNAT superfamily N-acetyltransferase
VKIRDATPDDAAVLARLHVTSRRAAMPWLAEVHADDDVIAYMATEVLPRLAVRVAEADRILGFAAIDVAGGELDHLYLDPLVRRRGIGSALLADAKALAPGGLALWVFQRNTAARRFYEARGFRLLHETDGAGNEEREPDARYRWDGA